MAEMDIDDTAFVVSQVDFEGFMDEVNLATGGGECSGAMAGEREVVGGGGGRGRRDASGAH